MKTKNKNTMSILTVQQRNARRIGAYVICVRKAHNTQAKQSARWNWNGAQHRGYLQLMFMLFLCQRQRMNVPPVPVCGVSPPGSAAVLGGRSSVLVSPLVGEARARKAQEGGVGG